MTPKEFAKIEALLMERFSIHETDYLLNMITDEEKTEADIKNFTKYVSECNKNDIETDIEEYESLNK